MDIFSHILWAYVPFRNKIWRDEGLFFAVLPDVGFALILIYALFFTPMLVSFSEAVRDMPDILLSIYFIFHSFVTLGIVALIVWKFKPRLLPALSGWFIHIMIDIPVHDGTFGTRFLYPFFPDLYIPGISWLDIRVLGVSYLALVIVYVYSLRRERKKHVMKDRWQADWIDKFHEKADALINRKRIRGSHARRSDNEGASDQISGEDGEGPGEGEDLPAPEIISQDPG